MACQSLFMFLSGIIRVNNLLYVQANAKAVSASAADLVQVRVPLVGRIADLACLIVKAPSLFVRVSLWACMSPEQAIAGQPPPGAHLSALADPSLMHVRAWGGFCRVTGGHVSGPVGLLACLFEGIVGRLADRVCGLLNLLADLGGLALQLLHSSGRLLRRTLRRRLDFLGYAGPKLVGASHLAALAGRGAHALSHRFQTLIQA
mmetsp:Transcript_16056/g.45430  ORF Transcript_16056/g.45430 Transcript_16056/m.45430 type:complete len:204 (+) Transcript_16056:160-771(+)